MNSARINEQSKNNKTVTWNAISFYYTHMLGAASFKYTKYEMFIYQIMFYI